MSMVPQSTFGLWVKVEGDGTEWLQVDALPDGCPVIGCYITPKSKDWDEARALLRDYLEMDIDSLTSIEAVQGWGARFSSPGYLDCTPWVVFPEEGDAVAYLLDVEDRVAAD